MLMTMDAALASGSRSVGGCHPTWLSRGSGGFDASSQPIGCCRRSPRSYARRSEGASDLDSPWIARNNFRGTRHRALPEHSGSLPEPRKNCSKSCYHPLEDIVASWPPEGGEDSRLSDAEIARTIVEVNSKATLMFSGLIDSDVYENIFCPNLPYLTDECGDIYFEEDHDDDILHTLTNDDKLVQVIIGLEDIEMLAEMEASRASDFDFRMEAVTSDDSEVDNDYEEEDLVTILEDEQDLISSETLGDWADLETVQSSDPMYFAKKMEEVVSSTNTNWMDKHASSIIVQGLLRPSVIEEHRISRKCIMKSSEIQFGGRADEEELENDHSLQRGSAFYKLEIVNIQLVSSYGNQSAVKVQDFGQARPDVLAHSAASIISRLEAGGEKTSQALKSLCWRCKGLKVEEAAVTGVDSLGFDLKVCSGTQVQALRFAFNARVSSEYSAERQLNDLLFPRFQKTPMQQKAHQNEC